MKSGNKMEIKSESYKGDKNEAYCKVVAVPAGTQRIPLPGKKMEMRKLLKSDLLPILSHGFDNYISYSAKLYYFC